MDSAAAAALQELDSSSDSADSVAVPASRSSKSLRSSTPKPTHLGPAPLSSSDEEDSLVGTSSGEETSVVDRLPSAKDFLPPAVVTQTKQGGLSAADPSHQHVARALGGRGSPTPPPPQGAPPAKKTKGRSSLQTKTRNHRPPPPPASSPPSTLKAQQPRGRSTEQPLRSHQRKAAAATPANPASAPKKSANNKLANTVVSTAASSISTPAVEDSEEARRIRLRRSVLQILTDLL